MIGPSGYGKSLTADKLAFDLRQADPPYEVVRESDGLAAIEAAFATPGRVLFHLEDPWGQSGLKKGDAADWTKRISALIHQRAADKLFVITSRSEIHRAAVSPSPPPVWADRTVVIDDAAYDQVARGKILYGPLDGAGGWRLDFTRQHEARLLRALKSPFELNAFARELNALGGPGEAVLDTLVDRALSDSRLQVVRDQIDAYGDRGIRGAAVLWALLRQSRTFPPARLSQLRREVDKAAKVDIGLDDLAKHLAQTQLTLDGEGDYAAHSKVVEAMEAIASEQFRAAEGALNAVAAAALALVAQDRVWLEVAARLITGARALEAAGVELDGDVVTTFDNLLIEALKRAVDNPREFRRAWRSADRRLSLGSPIGRLVDWLEHGAPKSKKDIAEFGWIPPKVTKAERDALLAADPDLRIMKGFIAHLLPQTHTDYDAGKLLPWLKAFGADFAQAFLAAGNVVAKAPEYVVCADAIAEGALECEAPPYDAVWAQIVAMQAAVDMALTRSREERRQAWQGEIDFAAGLHIQERVEDEGPSAEHFAKGYVRSRRRQQGHGWIAGHPRQDIILRLWAEVMKWNRPKVTPTELDAFFAAAGANDDLQAAGLSVIADRRLEFARPRVLTALTSGGPRAVDAAVRALSFLEGDDEGQSGRPSAQTILLQLLPTLPPVRAAILAPEICDLEVGAKRKAALAQKVLDAAPPDGGAAVQLVLARALGADDATLLEAFRALPEGQAEALMADGPQSLTRLLLLISGAEGLDVQALAEQWAVSDDEDDAQAAVRTLAELGTVSGRAAIAKALDHPDYRVRRRALESLAPKANATEKVALLSLSKDKSAPVRETLARVIGEERWPEGIDALLVLLGDRRNYARHPEYQRRDEPMYQVGRAAAAALGQYTSHSAHILDGIISFLAKDAEETIDVELHGALLDLLTYPDHPAAWNAIEAGLDDHHVVGDTEENLYPVRYAAAWAVVHRICRHPTEHGLVPWASIRAAVDHVDPQLAAPLLLALGVQLSVDCDAATLEALRGSNASEVRIALALSMIDDRAAAKAIAIKHGLLPADHPLFDDTDDVASVEAEFTRWAISTRGRNWLESLRDGSDVETTLLWVMTSRTGLPLIDSDFNPSALRRKQSMPIMTFAEMFGME